MGRALVCSIEKFIYASLSCTHVYDNVHYLPVEKRTYKYKDRDIAVNGQAGRIQQ